MESDLTSVLLEGHGIPNLHLDYSGISIAYWMDKEAIKTSNWNGIQQSFEKGENHASLYNSSRLLISFEDAIQPMHFLPATRSAYLLQFDESEESIEEGADGEHFKVVTETLAPKFMPAMRFVKPLPSNQNTPAIPIRYVFTLDPPMPVSDEICQKLMTATGLINIDSIASTPVIVNGKDPANHTQALEDMLAMDVGDHVFKNSNNEWVSSSEDEIPDQIYKWMQISPTRAKMITRIPFQHPVQIYNILQVNQIWYSFSQLYVINLFSCIISVFVNNKCLIHCLKVYLTRTLSRRIPTSPTNPFLFL